MFVIFQEHFDYYLGLALALGCLSHGRGVQDSAFISFVFDVI
jgi:hypothetical protein